MWDLVACMVEESIEGKTGTTVIEEQYNTYICMYVCNKNNELPIYLWFHFLACNSVPLVWVCFSTNTMFF